jgi:hypothetical protein
MEGGPEKRFPTLQHLKLVARIKSLAAFPFREPRL